MPSVIRPRMRSRSWTARQRVAQPAAVERAEGQLLDGVEPVLDALHLDERAQDPVAERPAAHRGLRVVEHVQQRAAPAAVGEALDELEVAAGERVDREHVLGRTRDERRDVGQVALLRLAQVAQGRAGGGRGPRQALAAEGLERRDAEVGQQLAPGALELEGAVVDRRARDLGLGLRGVAEPLGQLHAAAQQQLARPRRADLVAQPLEAARPVPLRDGELAGRGLEPGDPEARRPRLDRHHEGALAGVEGALLELGGRRDHAHDLALDDALGGARVLHLLAERDAEALAHQAGDVARRRVVGHAAHRDGLAVLVLGARGEGDLERSRGDHGVVEEQLVEVAHAEEHERVRVLGLHPVVLLHRRGLLERGGRHGGRWSIS